MNEITTGMDQPLIPTAGEMLILDEVDSQVQRSLVSGDIRIALRFGRSLRRNMQVQGLALAKLLAKLQGSWEIFSDSGTEDDFYDIVYTEMGVALQTTKKYVGMWNAVFENEEVSDEVKHLLMGRPIKSLLLLTAAANDGSLDWEKVADTSTHSELQGVVREARGLHTSAVSRITIQLNRTTGELTAWQGDSFVSIGGLLIGLEGEMARKAIERIINSSGILEV